MSPDDTRGSSRPDGCVLVQQNTERDPTQPGTADLHTGMGAETQQVRQSQSYYINITNPSAGIQLTYTAAFHSYPATSCSNMSAAMSPCHLYQLTEKQLHKANMIKPHSLAT